MPFTTVELRRKTGQINSRKKLLSSGTATSAVMIPETILMSQSPSQF